MRRYECPKCKWTGDGLQVETVEVYRILDVEPHEVEDEEERIEICPQCLRDSKYKHYEILHEIC